MDYKEKRIQSLNKLALQGVNITRLQESEEWSTVVEALEESVGVNLAELLEPTTTSQRYYELRAEINSVKKLLELLEARKARGNVAGQQISKLRE